MRWEYESVVESTIRDFCAKQLPDARDLDDLVYIISAGPVLPGPFDRTYQVEVNIPTSAKPAGLVFVLDCNADEPRVSDVTCMRSGRGNLADHLYYWTRKTGEWETVNFGDE